MFLFLSLAAVVLAYLFIVIACVKTTNKFLDSNFMQRAAVWQGEIRQRNAAAATNVDLNLPHSPSAEPECIGEGVGHGNCNAFIYKQRHAAALPGASAATAALPAANENLRSVRIAVFLSL